MHTIWKYPLPADDAFEIWMPEDARILTVQMQGDNPCLWALVEQDRPQEARSFRVVGTGDPIPDRGSLRYIGTFQVRGGSLVFHLFDATPIKVTLTTQAVTI